MIDREKVIKSLKWFRDRDSWREGIMIHDDHAEVRKQICDNAIELLKEQDAVEPYIIGSGESFETAETWWYECGNCNKPIDPNDKFCRYCGKAVKWE